VRGRGIGRAPNAVARRWRGEPRQATLPRPTRCMRDVAGRTYREIARDLFVSEKTVSTHVSNMLRRFGLTSRVELSQLASRHALRR